MRFFLQHFEQLPSTNDYATELLAEGPPPGTIIRADYQYAGRGQKGNKWWVEAGQNLTFSLILYPNLPVEQVYYLSKAVAVALQETVQEFLPRTTVQIKWPNDLLVNGRKVAGILIENQLEGRRVRSSVIGLGLNVNQRQFFPEQAPHATSMALWTEATLSVEAIFQVLLPSLSEQIEKVFTGAFPSLDQAYLRSLYGYQQSLWVEWQDRKERAHLLGVEPSGRLVLEIAGQQHSFDLKEVKLLLPKT